MMHPKPAKRGPKPPRRIARTSKPPRQSRSRAAVARRKADREWAKCIRIRADGWCEWTLDRGTDAHHVVSRRYQATRHLMANGVYLSRTAHRAAHRDPAAFRAWFQKRFPHRWAAILEILEKKL